VNEGAPLKVGGENAQIGGARLRGVATKALGNGGTDAVALLTADKNRPVRPMLPAVAIELATPACLGDIASGQ
jgi:hypothetical protein